MNKAVAIFIGLLLLVVLVLFTTSYTVSYHEIAIRTRFGQVGSASVITEPGLHFKLPFFADRVNKYDTRLQLLETPLEQIQTADKQPVVVTAFLMWQVDTSDESKALDFATNYRSVDDAAGYLLNQFRDRLGVLGRYRFDELIGENNKLQDAEQALLAEMKKSLPKGVVPRTVGLSQLVLPPKTTAAVLGRMKATTAALATAETTKGLSESQTIIAHANSKADTLTTFAKQHADEIRAEGSAEAARYLAQMQEHADFAMFLTWLTALEDMLKENSTFFLQTNTEPFHLLDPNAERNANGIPVPANPMLGTTKDLTQAAPGGGASGDDDADVEETKAKGDKLATQGSGN